MQAFLERVDPELRDAYPPQIGELAELFISDLEGARSIHRKAHAARRQAFAGRTERARITGLNGDPDIDIVSFHAPAPIHPDGAIIWLHGGGFWAGTADDSAAHFLAALAPVHSVEYRLSPEHPAPAAVRDACAAIAWASSNGATQIAIAGASAGGGVAAGAALMNRDRCGPSLSLQLLLYPALDNRAPIAHGIPASFGGSESALRHMWSLYLGNEESPYGAPGRMADLSGLPPACLIVGELDFLLSGCLDYAQRLREAGGAISCSTYAGAPHGFDHIAPDARVSRLARDTCLAFVDRALGGNHGR